MKQLSLEERVRVLEDEIARMKRENDDTLSNLDTSNLGSGLANRLNKTQTQAQTLSDVIKVTGTTNNTTVTIRAHRINFENIKAKTNEKRLLGYVEVPSAQAYATWHLPNVSGNGNYD